MTLHTLVEAGLALLAGYGAVQYFRLAKRYGIRLRHVRAKDLLGNTGCREKNTGINLLLFGLVAAAVATALILKAFDVW
jgi:hypothetical protein